MNESNPFKDINDMILGGYTKEKNYNTNKSEYLSVRGSVNLGSQNGEK